MKMRFMAAAAAAVFAASLGGCGNEIHENKDVSVDMGLLTADEDIVTDEELTFEELTPIPVEEDNGEDEVKSFAEVKVKAAELKYEKFDETYQAEAGAISGSATGADSRKGFKGDGYVTGIGEEADWSVTADLPAEQYYNLVLTVAADEDSAGGLSINGSKISEFTVTKEGKFETRTFRNIKLKKGENKIAVIPESGRIDIDQVQVTASEEISKLKLTAKGAALSDKKAEYNAKALYKYLCDNYGSKVILAQNDTVGTSYESDLIYSVTGKYPAIRMGDMMYVTSSEHEEQAQVEINEALTRFENGAVIGYMWNWTSPNKPDDSESVYAENADFDITKAVTEEDVALMDMDTLETMAENGEISTECLQLMSDIDKVSAQLAKFRDAGAPVLWRPLQEASNGLYWWGRDPDAYIWLWNTMYTRMTEHNGLHNLIWVWSAQNANWFVGGDRCDVLSADIYGGGKGGQVSTLLYLQSISGGKPIAMSECDSMPLIQSLADERAMWSYIGQWGGSFIVGEDGKLSQAYNAEQDIITMYNNDLTITQDKLPDFVTMAEEVKKAEEKAAKEKDKEKEESEE
ncbi:glycosyl hydrolase [Ruminococcus sp.]|uniref:glycosyl hydrolase n=1 Tax=Ruminococcus sp. TaxID=41978 RepID=UPI0025FDDEAA|nr:glycosyl hydrolase [Ruminococcus sp.]MBQ8965050.1 glycoside hydrolase [Ruminococcus sp.]